MTPTITPTWIFIDNDLHILHNPQYPQYPQYLVQVLHVHAHVVTWAGLLHTLVVHLHGKHLASARVGSGVGGHEEHLITGLDLTWRVGRGCVVCFGVWSV